MMLLTTFSNKPALLLAALLVWGSVCSSLHESHAAEENKTPPIAGTSTIAVLPVFNLSGAPAPLAEIRQTFTARLTASGIRIVEEKGLESFMARHRLRYTGGLSQATGRAFMQEIGVEAVVITSLELFSDIPPPKLALTSRLVSTGINPTIMWIDGIGLAGDDSPGLLGLSLITDPIRLTDKAIEELTTSLTGFLSGHPAWSETGAGGKKFRPGAYYRSPAIIGSVKQTIAVVPFFNLSERKFAGEIMPLHFVRAFRELENFRVIEPGMIRDMMLRERMIMANGISMADTEVIFNRLNADLVLSGRVMSYQDYVGGAGNAIVDFFAQVVDRRHREVVWSSHSYRKGDDGVYFFGKGTLRTAHRLAFKMAASVGDMIAQ